MEIRSDSVRHEPRLVGDIIRELIAKGVILKRKGHD